MIILPSLPVLFSSESHSNVDKLADGNEYVEINSQTFKERRWF